MYFKQEYHPLNGQHLGCIVGVLTDPLTAQPTGSISRTYLDASLNKIGPAKTFKTDGMVVGIVRLSEDADVLPGLHLAEGIESALTTMAEGFRPCWSTGSKNLMAAFPVIPGIESLTLFADHDANGAGEKAARAAEARWRSAGHKARIIIRDRPGDFNDAVMEGGS